METTSIDFFRQIGYGNGMQMQAGTQKERLHQPDHRQTMERNKRAQEALLWSHPLWERRIETARNWEIISVRLASEDAKAAKIYEKIQKEKIL